MKTNVWIVRWSCAGSWEEVTRYAMERFGWTGETSVFAYTEAVSACSLSKPLLRELVLPIDALEGRAFALSSELRWNAEAGDGLRAWLTREFAAEPSTADVRDGRAVHVEVASHDYFLIGRGTGNATRFREARYPGRTFVYPVSRKPPSESDGKPAQVPDDAWRAFIKVAEYFRREPDWTAVEGEAHLTDALDAPLLVAHRFDDVDVSHSTQR